MQNKNTVWGVIKSVFKDRLKFDASYLIALFASIILALLVGAGIMAIVGYNPIECYEQLVTGAFGSPRAVGDTIAKSATLCITGLAMAIAAKAGMFNVGGEGQLFMGAIVSAIVGVYLGGVSPFIAIPTAILCAALAGALLALFPAVLKVKMGISEVVVTILLNTAAIKFCGYLASGPFKTTEGAVAVGTTKLAKDIMFEKLVPLSNLTSSIYIAAVMTLLVWYFMTHTTGGYEYGITGKNAEFAKYSGLKTNKIAVWSMIISGAMCGLVGMFEVYGNQGRFVTTISNEFYFDGMLVAMIMRYNPFGIILMSIFFAMMKIGSASMELKVGISSELILVIQSIIIFFMAAENGITSEIKRRRDIARAKKSRKEQTI